MKLSELMELEKQVHMPTYSRLKVDIVKGDGVKVWDSEGRQYIDCIAGLGVMNLGHTHKKIVETIKAQVEELIHITNLFYIEPQLKLAEKLIKRTFTGKCFFANSGAEVNEGAVKLARKYAKKNYNPKKYEIITAWNSFHGRTLAMLTATGQKKKRKDFKPLVPGFKHVNLNDVEELEKTINKNTCAFLIEPIQGEGGVYPCTKEYLTKAKDMCDQYGALLIFDEVQTGMGRTGHLFAYQYFEVEPDIITMAKGLGGGLPIGAILASNKIAETFEPGDHGSTFGGGPLITLVAQVVLDLIDNQFLKQIQITSKYFKDGLKMIENKYPSLIKEVRGLGLMLAMELKEPKAKEFALDCLEKGLIVNFIGKNIIRFLPPLIIEKEQVDKIMSIIDICLGSMKNKYES